MTTFPSQEAENIVTKVKQQQYQDLLGKDQLSVERNDGKVFLHFGEPTTRSSGLCLAASRH